MDACCALLLRIVDELALRDAMQAAHDRCLDQTDRAVHVVILDARNQDFFALLQQVLLNRSDVLNVADVLVELWIDGHVLGANSESLTMLVLVLDVQNERDARWILAHHFLEEAHGQVNAFNDKRLISPIKVINDFCKFFRNKRALLFVSFECDPVF